MPSKLPPSTTSVSIRASRDYINALRNVAAKLNRPVADLVREALDNKYGAEIETFLSFFESSGYQNSHLDNSEDNGVIVDQPEYINSADIHAATPQMK